MWHIHMILLFTCRSKTQTFLDDYYPGPGFCSVMLVTQQFECISENSLGNIHDCGA